MFTRSQASPAAPAATEPPRGFTYSPENEHFVNDLELHEGPQRSNKDLRVSITSDWCPQDGTRLWIDQPPSQALTIEQAKWIASSLPEVIADIEAPA